MGVRCALQDEEFLIPEFSQPKSLELLCGGRTCL